MMRAARRLLRPLFLPILNRIEEVRHIAVELDRALPLVRNSIESQNAELRASARHRAELRSELDRFHDDLLRAQEQIDALRDEFALALTAGVPVSPSANEASSALRLVFGDEVQTSVPEHTVVDLCATDGADLADSVCALSFVERSAAEVLVMRILERHSIAELRDVLLPYWRRLLMPGAELVALGVPADGLDGLLRLLDETGYVSIETVRRSRAGAPDSIEVRARGAADGVAPAIDARSRNSKVHAG